MTTDNVKIILPLVAVMILTTTAISAVTHAQITPVEDDGASSVPTYTREDPMVDEKNMDERMDAIGLAIVQLQIQNDELVKYSADESTQEKIKNNSNTINGLFAELDALMPPAPIVEISDSVRTQMEYSIEALVESGLPVYSLNINSSTGSLDIMVESASNIDDKIRAIAGDSMPLNIKYGINTFRLQASP